MKKTGLLFMMLFASCSAFLSSCSTEEGKGGEGEKEVTLAVTGNNGSLITVYANDVMNEVVIKATEIVDRDIEVTLTTDNTDGSAVLAATTATIAKGTDKAIVKITFPASKFPRETKEKAIKVTAVTNADKVVISPDFTTFNVRGEEGEETPATLTATQGDTEIFTTNEPGSAVINFKLSKPLSIAAELNCQYERVENNIDTDQLRWYPFPVEIPAGATSLAVKITAPQGIEGNLKINVKSTSGLVIVETEPMEFKYTVNEEAEISTATTGYVNVGAVDVTKQIKVTLNKSIVGGATVNLAVSSNNELLGTLSTSEVRFEEGQTSKNVDITFAAADFIKDAEAVITVTATSEDVDVRPSASNVVFKVAGPSDKVDGQVMWYILYDVKSETPPVVEGDIYFPNSYLTKGYLPMYVYAEVKNPAFDDNFFFDPPVTFELVLTGNLTTEDIVFEEGTDLIYSDTNFGSCNFKIMKSAIGKEGTIDFISKGTTFIYTQKPCRVKVVGQ